MKILEHGINIRYQHESRDSGLFLASPVLVCSRTRTTHVSGRYNLFSSISELLQQNMSSCFLINAQTDKSSELTNGTQAEDAILTEVELLPLAVNNLQEIQTPINLRVLSEPPDEQLITAEFKPPIPPRKPLEKGEFE